MAETSGSDLGRWRAVSPTDAAAWLAPLTVQWWFAGGWAIDLHAGAQSRPHGDLDVGILRRDLREFLAMFSSWEVYAAEAGALTRLSKGALPRRQPDIRRRLSSIVLHTPQALPYLAPEIQLLYKSRSPRARDEDDFRFIAPRLDDTARSWLSGALARTDPGHAWLEDLKS